MKIGCSTDISLMLQVSNENILYRTKEKFASHFRFIVTIEVPEYVTKCLSINTEKLGYKIIKTCLISKLQATDGTMKILETLEMFSMQ